ncbi:hypothetical protein GKG47_06000 [Lactonifactor sp. BIOML-A3]|uniref:hypothetical protein n=1 Tax=unclassified Lactonifactor TaxID=2636670 RepID=UPI0012B14C23|nr:MULTISPECIES: hypothetical protein [unclassified Lactonifactor]MSA01010.1 hypothetical protein [Lactonifactor sp. BIOML-A5]MSA07804.1 hypothetical protein [Lactonifactor sp. BIOML-A4]MSA12000.1 hypothetical protein [Lactonifactor sp. BIOML-A3]MSA16440.1 hypothetical protein [Lactonifactor sp. BIOML-A2]MSA37044.1 hypothetical protein [Lactonifactor sp. BIOML-A1]
MGRRPKNMTTIQRLEFVEQQIADKESELKDLKAELRQLKKKKEEEDMAALYLEIQKQGLSIEDALNKITSEQQ